MIKIKSIPNAPKKVDVTALFLEYAQKYRNVYITQIEDEVFIYRSLGRSEYQEIMEDNRFENWTKEELLCQQCLLYPNPDEYDWENCNAGVPTQLCASILDNSYLMDIGKRKALLDYYRSEMYNLDNQMTCLINEAFPNLDLEEIESWDVDKTSKYYSRAEWKLHNLHGMPFVEPEGEYYGSQENVQEEPKAKENPKMDREQTLRGGSRKDKLTPDKIKDRTKQVKEYEEFLRKYPEFAAQNGGVMDDAIASGIDGLAQPDVDDRPPALRPGW